MELLSKFICGVFESGGAEQAIAFPMAMQHNAVWEYMCGGNPEAKPVSAGFFHQEGGQVDLVTGNSESMAHYNNGDPLPSRPAQDGALIQQMLNSAARNRFDLRLQLYRNLPSRPPQKRPAPPEMSMS
jgi:hypothetical protein